MKQVKQVLQLYMGTIVIIVSRNGLTTHAIEVHHRNQPEKSKLALYKPLVSLLIRRAGLGYR